MPAQGNYRAATAQEMGEIYSRNIAQQQILSQNTHKAVKENENAEFLPAGRPDFKELAHQGDSTLISSEVHGGKPMDWALEMLKIREQSDVLKRNGEALRGSFVESPRVPGGQMEQNLAISQEVILPEKKEKEKKEAFLSRAEDLECLNFRFATDSLTEDKSLLRLFLLTCGREGCHETFRDRGTYRAVSPSCHKDLDETDMFILLSISWPR